MQPKHNSQEKHQPLAKIQGKADNCSRRAVTFFKKAEKSMNKCNTVTHKGVTGTQECLSTNNWVTGMRN